MKEFAAFVLVCLFAFSAQAADAVPLPAGQDKTPYPTDGWAEYAAGDPLRVAVEGLIARAFEGARPVSLARTRAMVVIVHGRLVAERYSEGLSADSRLQSWSVAKSLLHAALGVAIADGKLNPDAPAPVPEWQGANDPRRAITLRQLAQMTDGLSFSENYGDTGSEVMQMLFGAGRGDVGAAAARAPAAHAPGSEWSYSSGSANILSRVLRDALGGREAYAAFVRERLFKPLGMTSAVAEFDASGTWIASSYVHATARDYAKFGLLYLNRGLWEMRQLVPRDWAGGASQTTAASKGRYGALFWLNGRDAATGKLALSDKLPEGLYFARGFGGQLVAVVPSHDAVIVMMNASYGDDSQPIIDLMVDVLSTIKPG
ncbi:MAG: serine hydrolase [Alphaproteobacteria bacterium]|nr:serine hydrolase [Alphaproteobacteria bacterium]